MKALGSLVTSLSPVLSQPIPPPAATLFLATCKPEFISPLLTPSSAPTAFGSPPWALLHLPSSLATSLPRAPPSNHTEPLSVPQTLHASLVPQATQTCLPLQYLVFPNPIQPCLVHLTLTSGSSLTATSSRKPSQTTLTPAQKMLDGPTISQCPAHFLLQSITCDALY